MKMQIEPEIKVKEKMFYYPTTFEKLEDIIRNGFQSKVGEDGVTFYPSSTDANQEIFRKILALLSCLNYMLQFISISIEYIFNTFITNSLIHR